MGIETKLAELESLHRDQIENRKYYFWERKDDEQARYWQEKANQTKAEILDFKEKHSINTPNWWE